MKPNNQLTEQILNKSVKKKSFDLRCVISNIHSNKFKLLYIFNYFLIDYFHDF